MKHRLGTASSFTKNRAVTLNRHAAVRSPMCRAAAHRGFWRHLPESAARTSGYARRLCSSLVNSMTGDTDSWKALHDREPGQSTPAAPCIAPIDSDQPRALSARSSPQTQRRSALSARSSPQTQRRSALAARPSPQTHRRATLAAQPAPQTQRWTALAAQPSPQTHRRTTLAAQPTTINRAPNPSSQPPRKRRKHQDRLRANGGKTAWTQFSC